MRRNFTGDIVIMLVAGVGTGLMVEGVKTNAPALSMIAVTLAIASLAAKFMVSKDRRKQNQSSSNSPRRRSTDQHQDEAPLVY